MADLATPIDGRVIFLFASGNNVPIGTALIVGYPVPQSPGTFIPLVVTAKRVIGDRSKIIGRYTTKEGKVPAILVYDLDRLRASGDLWEHPDPAVDIAIFRTPHPEVAYYEPFPMDAIASKETYAREDIKTSDRVIFPCLLVSFMGGARNYPVARDGSIALIPEEPVPLQYLVGSNMVSTEQEVVFIDATSIPGASGCPVFLWPGPRLVKGETVMGGSRPWLLGVMHGFYKAAPRELVGSQTKSATPGFAENSGIAVVFPSWRLLEILQGTQLSQRMEQLVAATRPGEETARQGQIHYSQA